MTNRDAADNTIMGAAVAAWLATPSAGSPPWGTDEADIACETVMLAQGVISPDESVSYIGPWGHGIVVTIDGDDDDIVIRTDGTTVLLTEAGDNC